MMFFHVEVHLKGYFLMSISLQKYTVCRDNIGASGSVKNQPGVFRIPIVARGGFGVCRGQQEVALDVF